MTDDAAMRTFLSEYIARDNDKWNKYCDDSESNQ